MRDATPAMPMGIEEKFALAGEIGLSGTSIRFVFVTVGYYRHS